MPVAVSCCWLVIVKLPLRFTEPVTSQGVASGTVDPAGAARPVTRLLGRCPG